MVCEKCGSEIPADSLFCQSCGQPVGNASAQPERWQAFKSVLSDGKEKIVAVLGAAVGKQLMATGESKGGCAILSDKRLYLKGTCYRKRMGTFMPKKEDVILDVKDINGTGHFMQDASWMKLWGIILLAAALVTMAIFDPTKESGSVTGEGVVFAVLMFYVGLIGGIILLVNYKRCHAGIFQIVYSGNVVGLNTNYIPKEEWEFFQNYIRQQKDIQAESIEVKKPEQNEDLASQLRQYKQLLDEGMITQEEFDALKKKLLNI